MSRQLRPVPNPYGMPLVSVDEVREATACDDCASTLFLTPMQHHPTQSIVFGVFIAHDDTCPAMKAAAAQQQKGDDQP